VVVGHNESFRCEFLSDLHPHVEWFRGYYISLNETDTNTVVKVHLPNLLIGCCLLHVCCCMCVAACVLLHVCCCMCVVACDVYRNWVQSNIFIAKCDLLMQCKNGPVVWKLSHWKPL
jgi:hypothetical protein